ncbi:MAG: hypothetical protein HIU89_12950 [Proteobacteria bacterium]|nr:hypothetical protein [Pseudomonadota bacterium]
MLPLVITRPAVDFQLDARERELHDAGIELRRFPLIEIMPPRDPEPALQALAVLHTFDCAIPVSPTAVHATFRMLKGPWPASCAVGLIGPGSRAVFEQALRLRNQQLESVRLASAPADAAESEGLWVSLQALRPQGWAGAKVLLLRGGSGRNWLADTLVASGALVQFVDVYRRESPPADAATLSALRTLLTVPSAWLLTASEGLLNFQRLLAAGGLQAKEVLATQRALVIHARIAEAAAAVGFGRVDVCSPEPSAIIRALAFG